MNFSEPMKKLGELILQGKFHHNGDPVLAWMVGNVVFHRDHKDNIYPNKAAPANKIDGVIALIMALARMSQGETSTTSFWEKLNDASRPAAAVAS
jgi:phage terminase large subunit-like protein